MKKQQNADLIISSDYRQFIEELKAQVVSARVTAARAITHEAILLNQIKAGAYERAVTDKKTHNFDLALPEHFAEQADEMLKSSYSLDFFGLGQLVQLTDGKPSTVKLRLKELVEKGYLVPKGKGRGAHYVKVTTP